ncbi:hypothetical protein DNTS_018603 [Danionella cerebrum]|uniref:Uncharacterized protein n=1 Tax=Danionella cerebrum TaxID=2873325 RepID=A0A553Q9M2_9TELE|nr:hypothetical protein DNTS_018603 [Danionella translucida]
MQIEEEPVEKLDLITGCALTEHRNAPDITPGGSGVSDELKDSSSFTASRQGSLRESTNALDQRPAETGTEADCCLQQRDKSLQVPGGLRGDGAPCTHFSESFREQFVMVLERQPCAPRSPCGWWLHRWKPLLPLRSAPSALHECSWKGERVAMPSFLSDVCAAAVLIRHFVSAFAFSTALQRCSLPDGGRKERSLEAVKLQVALQARANEPATASLADECNLEGNRWLAHLPPPPPHPSPALSSLSPEPSLLRSSLPASVCLLSSERSSGLASSARGRKGCSSRTERDRCSRAVAQKPSTPAEEGETTMRPDSESRYSLWVSCVLPLGIGCVLGSVWSLNPESTMYLTSSTFSHSETHHPAGAQHHPPLFSIHRAPAPLRGGHEQMGVTGGERMSSALSRSRSDAIPALCPCASPSICEVRFVPALLVKRFARHGPPVRHPPAMRTSSCASWSSEDHFQFRGAAAEKRKPLFPLPLPLDEELLCPEGELCQVSGRRRLRQETEAALINRGVLRANNQHGTRALAMDRKHRSSPCRRPRVMDLKRWKRHTLHAASPAEICATSEGRRAADARGLGIEKPNKAISLETFPSCIRAPQSREKIDMRSFRVRTVLLSVFVSPSLVESPWRILTTMALISGSSGSIALWLGYGRGLRTPLITRFMKDQDAVVSGDKLRSLRAEHLSTTQPSEEERTSMMVLGQDRCEREESSPSDSLTSILHDSSSQRFLQFLRADCLGGGAVLEMQLTVELQRRGSFLLEIPVRDSKD